MDVLLIILLAFLVSEIVVTIFWLKDSLFSLFLAWLSFFILYFIVAIRIIINDIIHEPWKRIWLIPLLIFVFPLFYLLLWSGRIWVLKYKQAYTRYENDKRINNKFARNIGKIVDFIGGHKLMEMFTESIKGFDNEAFHQLVRCWDGIGDWWA
jgi:hypothetical protein